jgi:hypothetical protein
MSGKLNPASFFSGAKSSEDHTSSKAEPLASGKKEHHKRHPEHPIQPVIF